MTPAATLISSAAFAGTVAVLVTRSIERFGGRLGGVLGTVPSTIVPASLGLYAASADRESFVAAMAVTPAGMLVNALFLWLWRALPPRLPRWGLGARLALMTALSLGAWGLGATASAQGVLALRAQAQGATAPLFAFGGLVSLLGLGLGLGACLRNPPAPRGHRPVPWAVLVSRGLLAAGAIAAAVWLAQHGGPVAAGVVSVFPALFLTTMVSLWLSQGEAVQAGAVGPMMLGASAVSAYALAAGVLMPALGAAPGALLAWVAAALGVSAPAAWLLHHQGLRSARTPAEPPPPRGR